MNIEKNETQRRINNKIKLAKVCHMSNAKWRKLFTSILTSEIKIRSAKFKMINDDRLFQSSIPGPEFEFPDKWGEDVSLAYASFGEIEYMFIPKMYEHPYSDPKRILPSQSNAIDALVVHLNKIAHFPIKIEENGLKILGYEW